MRRQLAVAVMAMGSMGSAAGCRTEIITPVVTSSVVVTPDEAGILEGESLQFTATVIDEFDQPVVQAVVAWSTTDSSIVRVDSDGRAWGLAPGATFIWARFNGAAGSALMTVAPALDCAGDVPTPGKKKKGGNPGSDDDDDDEDDDDDPRCTPPADTDP